MVIVGVAADVIVAAGTIAGGIDAHFAPASTSWLSLVERWFAELTTPER